MEHDADEQRVASAHKSLAHSNRPMRIAPPALPCGTIAGPGGPRAGAGAHARTAAKLELGARRRRTRIMVHDGNQEMCTVEIEGDGRCFQLETRLGALRGFTLCVSVSSISSLLVSNRVYYSL